MNHKYKEVTSNKYTKVLCEKDFLYNSPHYFKVVDVNDDTKKLGEAYFQEGPILECGVNGVTNEDLMAMVICRLEHFQESKFNCEENQMALDKIKEALDILKSRTMKREARGVEGTHEV